MCKQAAGLRLILCASSHPERMFLFIFSVTAITEGAPRRRDRDSYRVIAPARRSYRLLLFMWGEFMGWDMRRSMGKESREDMVALFSAGIRARDG